MILDKYRDNMQVEFDFRKGSFADQSGNGNDLTTSTLRFGNTEKGRALVVEDSANIGTFPEVAVGDDLSIIVLTYVEDTNSADNVMFAYADVGKLAQFDINDNDSLRLYLRDTSPATVEVPLTTSEVKGRFNVFAVKRTGEVTTFYSNGVNIGAVAQTGTPDAEFGVIGNVLAGTKPWIGAFSYMAILGAAVSDEDMAKIYEELMTSIPQTAVDHKSNSRYINAVADGMMQKTGTDDWIEDGAGCVLSKYSDPERGQVLAVTAGGGAISYALQYNLGTGWYRLRGWIRADGTGGNARMKVGSTWMTGNTTDSTWLYVDQVIYNSSSASTPFKLGQISGSVNTTYYSDIECIKLNSDNPNDFASPHAYIADGKGWNESVANVTSGFLENTGWKVESGAWKVLNDNGFNKAIQCTTAGIVKKPASQIYGTWEFDGYVGSGTILDIVFASSDGTINNGYKLRFYPQFSTIALQKVVAASGSNLVTNATMLTTNTWVKIKITRTTFNIFKLWIDDTYIGTIQDATFTTCVNSLIEGDALNKVRNFKFIPYIQ